LRAPPQPPNPHNLCPEKNPTTPMTGRRASRRGGAPAHQQAANTRRRRRPRARGSDDGAVRRCHSEDVAFARSAAAAPWQQPAGRCHLPAQRRSPLEGSSAMLAWWQGMRSVKGWVETTNLVAASGCVLYTAYLVATPGLAQALLVVATRMALQRGSCSFTNPNKYLRVRRFLVVATAVEGFLVLGGGSQNKVSCVR
jgi:hypothetical protein